MPSRVRHRHQIIDQVRTGAAGGAAEFRGCGCRFGSAAEVRRFCALFGGGGADDQLRVGGGAVLLDHPVPDRDLVRGQVKVDKPK